MPNQKHAFMLIFVIMPALFAPKLPIYAQQTTSNSNPNLYWFNVGAGISSTDLSVGASLSYDLGGSFISIRYINNREFTFLGPTPSENVLDLGALYGKRVKTSYGLASISAGVAVVSGVRRGRYLKNGEGWFSSKEYEPITFTTIGIPIELQLFWEPTSFVGIGLYGFADLNPQASFVGVLICFHFGNLK